MLEDCYKIQREKKKNALGPASIGKKENYKNLRRVLLTEDARRS